MSLQTPKGSDCERKLLDVWLDESPPGVSDKRVARARRPAIHSRREMCEARWLIVLAWPRAPWVLFRVGVGQRLRVVDLSRNDGVPDRSFGHGAKAAASPGRDSYKLAI